MSVAAIVRIRIDASRAAEAAAAFSDRVLPAIAGAPGFEGEHWLDPDPATGEAVSLVRFASEAEAHAALPPEAPFDAPAVDHLSTEIRRVAVAI